MRYLIAEAFTHREVGRCVFDHADERLHALGERRPGAALAERGRSRPALATDFFRGSEGRRGHGVNVADEGGESREAEGGAGGGGHDGSGCGGGDAGPDFEGLGALVDEHREAVGVREAEGVGAGE